MYTHLGNETTRIVSHVPYIIIADAPRARVCRILLRIIILYIEYIARNFFPFFFFFSFTRLSASKKAKTTRDVRWSILRPSVASKRLHEYYCAVTSRDNRHTWNTKAKTEITIIIILTPAIGIICYICNWVTETEKVTFKI